MKLYLKIRELRQQKGMTQKELADKIGIDYQTISAYENYRQTPTIERALQIAAVLNCDFDELVDIEKYIKEYQEWLYQLSITDNQEIK